MVASSSSIRLPGYLDLRPAPIEPLRARVDRVDLEDTFDPATFNVAGWKIVEHAPGTKLRIESLPRRDWIRPLMTTLVALIVVSFLGLAGLVRRERQAAGEQDPGRVFQNGSLLILAAFGTPLFLLGLFPARPRRSVVGVDRECRRITVPERLRNRWFYVLRFQTPTNVTVPVSALRGIEIVASRGWTPFGSSTGRGERGWLRLTLKGEPPIEVQGPGSEGASTVERLEPLARSIGALAGVPVRGTRRS